MSFKLGRKNRLASDQFPRLYLQSFILWASISFFFLIYAFNNEPLWVDEVLHYAFGSYGFEDFKYVSDLIMSSTKNTNHGQTGFYFFLNYFFLNFFGSNIFALRLPTILSLFLIYYALMQITKFLNFSFKYKYLTFIGFSVNYSVIQYASEARSYLPLVSATILYFSFLIAKYEAGIKLRYVPWIAVIWGSLMHPYFVSYVIVLSSIFILFHKHSIKKRIVKEFIKLQELYFIIFSVTLTLVIAKFTWLEREINFEGMNPLEYIGNIKDLIIYFFAGNIPFGLFEINFANLVLVVLFYFFVITIALKFILDGYFNKIKIESIIILSVILLSLVLTVISFLQDYWILPRQWIASNAIITVSIFWIVHNHSITFNQKIDRHIRSGFFVTLTLIAIISIIDQLERIQNWNDYKKNIFLNESEYKKICGNIDLIIGYNAWVDCANYDIYNGNAVNKIFKGYYS